MVRFAGRRLLFAAATALLAHAVAAAQGPVFRGVLIFQNDRGGLDVKEFQQFPSETGSAQALLAWVDAAGEHLQLLPKSTAESIPVLRQISQLPVPSAHFALHAGLRLSVPRLSDSKTMLTPGQGATLLDPILVIRRRSTKDGVLPRAQVRLTQEDRLVATIVLSKGQARVSLADVPDLPAEIKQGLPAGKYGLSLEGSDETITFMVASKEQRAQSVKRIEEMSAFFENRHDPLLLQIDLERFLNANNKSVSGGPFLADALRVLENAPADSLTPYLRALHGELLRAPGVEEGSKLAPQVSDATTGIKEIDQALAQRARGQWAEALRVLDGLKPDLTPAGKRANSLAALCRAMVLAEAGLETADRADTLFQQALAELDTTSAVDRYLAHQEYAVFLLGRAEDRFGSAAFQRAAGVPNPVFLALADWCSAGRHLQSALEATRDLGPQATQRVLVNQARQYVILADLLRSLGSLQKADEPQSKLEQSALRLARQGAAEAIAQDAGKASPLLKGIAEEIKAHVDYRNGDLAACLAGTQRALRYFEQTGSLIGAESCLRLSGTCRLRMAKKQPPSQPEAKTAPAKIALRELSIAHALGEVLAERVPVGHKGRLLAGFFDRKAFVSGQLIDLLIEEGDAAGALQHAELARSRGLQALLEAHGSGPGMDGARPVADMLRRWPRDVTALEYYLGPRAAWVFAVDTTGQVKAYRLTDAAGKPLASEDLIRRVAGFRKNIDHYNLKMLDQANRDGGFDHTWQDELHRYYQELLPAPVRELATSGKTLVIVPHNVLHYFPFAALVTKPDTVKRAADQMVQPTFLIDQSISICSVPSLHIWDSLRQQKDAPITHLGALGAFDVPGAPQLPGSALELNHLRAAFGNNVDPLFLSEKATRTNANSLLGRPGMAVFSSHGFNDADRPLDSFLLCRPEGTSNGRLTAAQIYSSPLRVDLVVLSACYTGLAERLPLPGDNLFGFASAFLQGGAKTVVAGNWDIYDSTSPEVMKTFYERLAAGDPAPRALAHAQRAFLTKLRSSQQTGQIEPWLHPYFWAVYSVTGDDRSYFKQPSKP